MSENLTLFGRISQWFKRLGDESQRLPLVAAGDEAKAAEQRGAETPLAMAQATKAGSFWRPWGRRDAAMAGLAQGFAVLTELMTSIRDHLQRQGERQDEMLGHLSRLPEVLDALPESQRVQAEALKSISHQISRQIQQEERLSDILDKAGQTQNDQRKILESLSGQTEAVAEQNEAISENLKQAGEAMGNVGKATESSAAVLQQLQQDLGARNSRLEKIIGGQNTRLTMLLVAALVMSVVAIVAVGVVGFLVLRR